MPVFVKEYVGRIRKSNETQGKDGVYFGHGTREIATVRSILLGKELTCDADTIDIYYLLEFIGKIVYTRIAQIVRIIRIHV